MSFERLLRPRSIAVFGGAAAEELVRQCGLAGYEGEIWPVHPKKESILGCRAYRSVDELPGSPDAAYVAVNRRLTVDIVARLAARGAGGAVCYATGFTEAGAEGAELERRLLAACGDMPLVGPNCYGLLNYLDGAMLWPDQQGGRRVEKGIALVTMSSNVAFNLTMQRRGLPIAYVVSLGNKLKFDLHDAVRVFARQERVTAIGLYVESVSDPHALAAAAGVARELGKPIVAVKTGRSEAAQKIVLSHTASLAGSDRLIGALFERVGIARVGSLEELIEALKVVHVLGPLAGGRVGAMSTSGGDLSLLGDAMLGTGLTMPPLSPEGAARLAATVHERIVVANPLDYQMFDWNDEERLTETFSGFVAEGWDLSLCLLDYPRGDKCDPSSWLGAERAFIRAATGSEHPTGVLSTFTDTMPEELAERLVDLGIVPLAGIDAGLAGIRAAVDIGAAWSRAPAPPLHPAPAGWRDESVRALDEAESKAVLARYGIRVPAGRVVADGAAAVAAAAEIGLPVAVKALGVAHKTDLRGVALGLGRSAAVEAAVAAMSGLAERFLIEEMVDGAVAELIVGIAHDPQFGPHLVVGAGGTLVELVGDSVTLLLPVDQAAVHDALGRLQCAPLFRGYRGRPPADLDAAVEAILAVARLAEDRAASIVELDVNPLLLLAAGRGAVAADALLAVTSDSPRTDRPGETR